MDFKKATMAKKTKIPWVVYYIVGIALFIAPILIFIYLDKKYDIQNSMIFVRILLSILVLMIILPLGFLFYFIFDYFVWLSGYYDRDYIDTTREPFWIRHRNFVFAALGLIVVALFSVTIGIILNRLTGVEERNIAEPLSALLLIIAVICYALKTRKKSK